MSPLGPRCSCCCCFCIASKCSQRCGRKENNKNKRPKQQLKNPDKNKQLFPHIRWTPHTFVFFLLLSHFPLVPLKVSGQRPTLAGDLPTPPYSFPLYYSPMSVGTPCSTSPWPSQVAQELPSRIPVPSLVRSGRPSSSSCRRTRLPLHFQNTARETRRTVVHPSLARSPTILTEGTLGTECTGYIWLHPRASRHRTTYIPHHHIINNNNNNKWSSVRVVECTVVE